MLKMLEEAMTHLKINTVDISPLSLVIEQGFNPREAVIGEECYTIEPVKSTITSIKQAYKEGRPVELIKVVARNGKYYVRQGHCRTKALLAALNEGANIELITVVLIEGLSDLDEYLENLDGNQSNPLNQVAKAHGLCEAIRQGCTVDMLAQRYQCSVTAIRNTLKILDMPEMLQRMISHGKITKTLALEIMVQNGNDHEHVMKALTAKISQVERKAMTTPVSVRNEKKPLSDNKGVIGVKGEVIPESSLDPALLNDGVKATRMTRSSLGIKRLSHKKTEKLKSGFLALTDSLESLNLVDEPHIEINIDSSHAALFQGVGDCNADVSDSTFTLRLSTQHIKVLAELLKGEGVGLVLNKDQAEEIIAIRKMISTNN